MGNFYHGGFSAFALDFDGTLSDTRALHDEARARAFRLMAERSGDDRFVTVDPHVHAEAHRHGSNPNTIIGWVLERSGIVDRPGSEDPITHAVVELKNQEFTEIVKQGGEAVRGSIPFCRSLAARGAERLSIVTTARLEEEVMPFLRRYRMTDYFPGERIVSREDVPRDRLKPDPLAYQVALRKFGLEGAPERMLAVEDSPHGIEAARTAGLTVAGIGTYHTVDELHALEGNQQPHIVAADFAELGVMIKLYEH